MKNKVNNMETNDTRLVKNMIDDSLAKAMGFSTRKLGDTPTDDLQLVPRKYLQSVINPLFDHYTSVGNVTTSETTLYSDTIAANALSNNGDKLSAEYGGTFVDSGTATRQIKIYFGGTAILDTGALTLTLASAWTIYVTIVRVSSSVVRAMVSLTTEGAALAAYTQYTQITALTLTNTQILKITGTAAGVGAATNDIVGTMGNVTFVGAA